MAYQHLFGSASGGTSGAGYKTLASTPEFYNVMTDDELSNYNNYSFTGGDEHPVKFCHYYKEYKKCFIQSAVSFEYDYVGRNSSIAHTLVLSESESEYLLKEHICPFSPGMFMNSRSDDFERPTSETLPAVDYRFLACGDREHNTAVISKYFKSDIFARFILAILLSAENGYPIYLALPGTPREISLNAIRLMNTIIPAFPAEYKKKLGFMTNVTDTYAYEDVCIYFTVGLDLGKKFMGSAYCFDLTRPEPYVGGLDDSAIKECRDLIRAVIGNVLSYDNSSLNGYYDDILPKTDGYDRFALSRVNEIFFMWRFLSGAGGDNIDGASACRIITSFYDFFGIVDNKAAFLYRINGYWEKELEKCKAGGYAPATDVLDVVGRHYPAFGEDDKRNARRIWSFILIYTLQGGNSSIYDKLTSYEYERSELAADVFGYILYMYVGFVCRKDTNATMKAVYEKIVAGMAKSVSDGNDSERLFDLIGRIILAEDRYFDEMSLKKSEEYPVFKEGFSAHFEEAVAGRIDNAGLMKKFEVIRSLREHLHTDQSELGQAVYEHYYRSAFMNGIRAAFTEGNIAKIAEEGKAIADLARSLEDYPDLNNLDDVSLFRTLYDIIFGKRGLFIFFSFDQLVNKPERQKILAGWLGAYNSKAPEMLLSLLSHTTVSIGSGASMEYVIDYQAGYKAYFEATGHDREATLREINRFIAEVESEMKKPEYKALDLASYKEPTADFVNTYFFARSIDRKTLKDNESMMKRFDKVKAVRALYDGKEKKHKLFGKK